MADRLVIASEAEQELLQSIEWYETKQIELGQRFYQSFRACLETIKRNPLMSEKVRPPYRCKRVPRFPYVVLFEYSNKQLTIYSVFHCSQDPAKWQNRLPRS
jgi:plasmid stabilization system protein ParE